MKGMAAAFAHPPALRGRAAAGAARPRAAGEGRGARLDRDARPPRAAQGDVPRLVEEPRARRRRRRRCAAAAADGPRRRRRVSAKADILARVRSALGPRRCPRSRGRTAPPARSRATGSSTASASPSPSTARPSTARRRRSPRPCARSSAAASASACPPGFRDLGLAVIEDDDLSVARARRARRRRHRLRAGDRRHGHDRARLRPATPAAARSRSSPTTTSASSRRAPIVAVGARRDRRARRRDAPDHVRLRPVGDVGHRARPRRGRARPARARRDRRRIGKPPLAGKWTLAYGVRIADVFHALSAPARRAILDELTDRDGQTLFELCGRLTATGPRAVTPGGLAAPRRARAGRPGQDAAGTAGTSSTTSTPRRWTRSSGAGRSRRNEDHVTQRVRRRPGEGAARSTRRCSAS